MRKAYRMHPHPGSLPSVAGTGQSLWNPCTSKEVRPPSPSFCCRGGRGGGEEELSHGSKPGVKFWRAQRVGSWEVRSLSDVDRLPYLSNELRRLREDKAAFSETRQFPGSGEITKGGGVTSYCCSGMYNGLGVRGSSYGHFQPAAAWSSGYTN